MARIIKDDENYKILYLDGSMSICTKEDFKLFLKSFKDIQNFSGGNLRWDLEYRDMSQYPGETIAQINNDKSLTITDISPFEEFFKESEQKEISVKEYADKHKKSVEQIKVLCQTHRIEGARKLGRVWLIPENAPYPERRIKKK